MITFLTVVFIISAIVFLVGFNDFFLVNKALRSKRIDINNLMVQRIYIVNKQYKKRKSNGIIYGINNYIYDEKDLIFLNIFILTVTIPLAVLYVFFSFETLLLNIVLIIKTAFFYIGVLIILNDTVHHIVYKRKRLETDCLLTLLKTALELKKDYKVICNSFIGRLFFGDNALLVATKGNTKKEVDYEWHTLTKLSTIKCLYKENTIIAAVQLKEGIYEREFSKFIFESDQVEKDYFQALYEFPFMERSTVYDFEKLHHDIMQDLVDEERIFFFKDYLIKEEVN